MHSNPAAAELLELFHIPGGVAPGVYAVGLAAKRITLADQQRRAVNLVWALLVEGRVKAPERLAIIGGGVAGVTAAAYAVYAGLQVDLFDEHNETFTIQRGSSRWLHPNIYDWPRGTWRQSETSLPCMNWKAGPAGDVIATLRAQWSELLKDSRLRFHPMVRIDGIESETSGSSLTAQGQRFGPYASVILAIGFGEERPPDEIRGSSYWRDDDIHQRLADGGLAVVSGAGDGGLVDAIRAVLRDYKHENLGRIAEKASADRSLVDELNAIERNPARYPDGRPLTDALLAANVAAEVTAVINGQLTPNARVLLNSSSADAFDRGSCLLNRFIVAQLMKLGVVEYVPGRLDVSTIKSVGGRVTLSIGGRDVTAEAMVVRHGPSVAPTAAFPTIDQALAPARSFLRTYSAGVDRSRSRAWTELATPAGPMAPSSTLPVSEYAGKQLQLGVQDALVRRGAAPITNVVADGDTVLVRVELLALTMSTQLDLSRTQEIVVRDANSLAVLRVLQRDGQPLRVWQNDSPSLVSEIVEAIVEVVEEGTR